MAPSAIHQAATVGFNNAAAYDTHRPSYPAAAVQGLLTQLGLVNQGAARILDLAAGTGKLTEALAAREERFEIVAVEPLEAMRETLVAKELAGVRVEDGTAAKMKGVEDGWADVVVVAQVRDLCCCSQSLGVLVLI